MSIRVMTLAAGTVYLVSGPVLLWAAWPLWGWSLRIAVVLLWGSLGAVLATILLVLREQQRLLRVVYRRAGARRSDGVDATLLATSLREQSASQQEHLDAELRSFAAAIEVQVDHRVLGLHALLASDAAGREASGAGEAPDPGDPR